jgi:hypothetical protein
MTIAGPISSFNALQTNFTNGALDTWTFSVQALIPVWFNDYLEFTLPDEVSVPDATAFVCKPLNNIQSIMPPCSVNNKRVKIIFNTFTSPNSAFGLTIYGIKNPPSTKTSTGFKDV